MVSVQNIDFRDLLTRLPQDTQATLCLPHDPEYHHLLERFSDRNVKPAGAIFLPTTAQEVSAAVKFVNEHNIDLAVVCGGHSGCGGSSSDGGLVIDLRRMRTVTIDHEKKTVACGGGCLWKDVDYALGEHGLAAVGGTVNHTGIGGLTLGGGYGFLTGMHGLVIDNLIALEMVLASGEIVNMSNEENQELFWAVRGAGANFGVATKFTYKVHEQKNKVFMGHLVFPPVPTIVSAILDFINSYFSSDIEDGKTSIYVGTSCAPPDHTTPVIIVMGFYNGSEEEGSKLFKPLYDLNPIINHMTEMPYQEANEVLAAMMTHGDRKIVRGFTYNLPIQLSTFMDAFDSYKNFVEQNSNDPKIGQTFLMFESMSSRKITEFNNGCFGNRGKHYNGIILPRWTIKENDEEVNNWARRTCREITHKNGVVLKDGREPTYGNYDDLRSTPKDIFGDSYERLVELKAKYDPKNLFNKWHSLDPKKMDKGYW